MACAGFHGSFLNRTAFYLRYAGGNADNNSRSCKNGVVENLFDEYLEHTCGNVKIGDNAVFKRTDGYDRAGGASDDILCLLSDIADGVGAGIHRNNGRLAHDYALAL